MTLEQIKKLEKKNCLGSLNLGWNFHNSTRCKDDEQVYPYGDKYMRYFVRQANKGFKVGDFYQYYQ